MSIETSLLVLMLVILGGGSLEAGFALYQYNGAQKAANTGARIAAISDPVSKDIAIYSNTKNVGIERYCSQATQSCSQGRYDTLAMNKIIFGGGNDQTCASTSLDQSGMCDVFANAERGHVEITYSRSNGNNSNALDDADNLIKVTLKNVPVNFIFLDLIGFRDLVHLPAVNATLIGEDVQND